ncbi:MAG: hypothetical protein IJU95_09890 [Treponema sp.]|nr:hypothetical protein [Treponema sp.]
MTDNKSRFTIIVRSVLAVTYILLAVSMFVTGRSHTVLIDNHSVEDGSVKAIKGMTVTVNHNPPSEFMKGDRDKFTVKGQKLSIKVQSFDGSIDSVYTLKIPLREDNVLVSVPKLTAGLDGAMEKFQMD